MQALEEIKGLGKVTLDKLNHMGIHSIHDLLLCFPKKYKIQKIESIQNSKMNKYITLRVKVISKPSVFFFRKNLSKLSLQVESENNHFRVDIFNRHFLSKILRRDTEIVISGKFKTSFKVFTASELVLKKSYKEGIIPQYNLSDIHDSRMIKMIDQVLKTEHTIPESLPTKLLNKRHIYTIDRLIKHIHQPTSMDQLSDVITRLKYEELLMFSMRIALIKKKQSRIQTAKKVYQIKRVKHMIQNIGFELTNSQKKATNEIFRDLKSPKQMNRLLQGDVGSGKTIVAILAALATVSAGYQVALMAPTLVLAQQHFKTFKGYLDPYHVNIELLTSEIKSTEKYAIMDHIANQSIDIVIGTHALIQEKISFKKLGLVIIDEQHRFGVEQRRKLREKGFVPDLLFMSATPIPRSLAISVFESSDVSQITEKPKGRKKILTSIHMYSKMNNVFKIIKKELLKGHQAYVVCPLIESNDLGSSIAIEDMLPILKSAFPNYRIHCLHGKMSDQDKVKTIDAFKNGCIHILLSTTVIEVGLHVDQATSMVIMNANRFGLAQLHQLRGRIGRNDLQSYCYLIVDDDIEDIDRLEILTKSDDGFEISAYDLKVRGPGEFFGKHQAGIPNFDYANIIEDKTILAWTKADADEIIEDPDLQSIALKDKVIKTLESYHLD